MNGKKSIEEIAEHDGRFNPRALRFVYDGLGYTVKKISCQPGHVTGQILCEGLKQMALEKWGRLSLLVLNTWQVKSTKDIGEIVYLLIKHKWMKAQPTDSIDDFKDVFDFKTAFKNGFSF
jgi:uncharacterized repeat protein (TIGR04138 family)